MKIVGAAAIALGLAHAVGSSRPPHWPSHQLKSGPVASASVRIQIGMNVGGADGTVTGRGAAER